MKLLEQINSPDDLKRLNQKQLPELISEIRKCIIETVANTGGHLASSLGATELITAIHYVFDTPHDKIVYDVGHQAYTHKILTGRKDRFHTLRQLNGISGFIKPEESEYDSFISGHSCTSISAALGMAKARDLSGDNYKVVSVIGDGTLTGGMTYEALNNAGASIKNFLIILNENEMAISACVGAMARYLNKIITSPVYNRLKNDIEHAIKRIPALGERMIDIAHRVEEGLKGVFVPGLLFEELGFRYFGPVAGHDTNALIDILKGIKDLEQPVILHVVTKKGKGYRHAEEAPEDFHGISPFHISSGNGKTQNIIPTYTDVFGETLCKLAKYNPKILAITAAMKQGTGLTRFKELYPKRFFDVGIAEEHAVTFAAGLAKSGWKPTVAIYSTFLQRAYDQIIVDTALQNLPVVFAVDRAGLVGEDGPTHHGVFDISYMRHIPNMTIMQPKNENELQHMLYTAMEHTGPIAIRYPRGIGMGIPLETKLQTIPLGKSELIFEGKDGVILALGTMVKTAEETIKILRKQGIQLGLVNARFIKPLDHKMLRELATNYPLLITLEEHVLAGGFGSAVIEFLSQESLKPTNTLCLGIPDQFIPHGKISALKQLIGLTPELIAAKIKNRLHVQAQNTVQH